MNSDALLARIRETALALPEVEEALLNDQPTWLVDGKPFAWLDHGPSPTLTVAGADGEQAIPFDGGPDWTLIDDRIARGWELVAPARLLEAGGR